MSPLPPDTLASVLGGAPARSKGDLHATLGAVAAFFGFVALLLALPTLRRPRTGSGPRRLISPNPGGTRLSLKGNGFLSRAITGRMLSHRYRRHRAAACRYSSDNWHDYERNDDVFSSDYKDFVDDQ
jgi:hypothetical protein